MPVEFRIFASDLRQAVEQLKANRGAYVDTDFVDIVVSSATALFHAVGTESEMRVDGTAPGSVRVPLRVLNEVSEAFATGNKGELPVKCERRFIKVGTRPFNHPEITISKAPKRFLSLPLDMSRLDILALARVLPSKTIDDQGMRTRVNEAERARRSAIADAVQALQSLEIEERQLTYFVESHIREAADRLRKSLQAA